MTYHPFRGIIVDPGSDIFNRRPHKDISVDRRRHMHVKGAVFIWSRIDRTRQFTAHMLVQDQVLSFDTVGLIFPKSQHCRKLIRIEPGAVHDPTRH